MNIEVHQPKLEALIQQRLASGEFKNVEDVLIQALELALPVEVPGSSDEPYRTGAELVAAMQAMPYKDVEFEHPPIHLPVREVEF